MHHFARKPADLETLAILEQVIELASLPRHVLEIEHGPEDLLHLSDVLADADLGLRLCLDIGRGREMIGMGMGLEHPDDADTLRLRLGQNSPGRISRSLSRTMVIVEHRVDHGARFRVGVGNEIAHRIGGLIEKGFYGRPIDHLGLTPAPCS
jgi:hypothetical protein